ncbi:VCBS repeat-containing protein [Alteromonas sp. IB21]|uniref:FG-GAP repeat domain-containing protein n=1 Tax=Alteromonas sp. IB21 TaxID=2779369 RepID=UPI0018E8F546|nr:VCBS repeat-containing protein [Alteromonas sp. IB21]MBJ2130912.1 VCBS repeat-containing protein [Alteromonas sp. IB21]
MLKKAFPALLFMLSSYSMASPLLDETFEKLQGNSPVSFSATPVQGFAKESYSVMIPEDNNRGTVYVAYDTDASFKKQFPVTISKNSEEITFSVDESQNVVVSNTSFDIYSPLFAEQWDEEIASLLQQAHQQGLLQSTSFIENMLYVSSRIFEEDNKLYTSGYYEIELVIPQRVFDDFAGGWPGPARIAKPTYFANEVTETQIETVEHTAFKNSQHLLDKWLLPLYIDSDLYGLGKRRELSHELIDLSSPVHSSHLFDISINVQTSSQSILLTYNDTSVRYSPISYTDNHYVFYVEVETSEETFKFVAAGYKLLENTEAFTNALSSQFPFVQTSHLGMGIEERFDGDQIACEWMVGYEFLSDGSMKWTLCTERLTGEKNVIDRNPFISGTEGWQWQISNDIIEFENNQPYTELNKQTWVPIQTNEQGYTIILEYWEYAANYEGAPPNGYALTPRANMIKLVDVSQYTEAYANGGFGGDADGDGIEDGPDTDDDNDGMPDYYEESFSLNHLNSADRDEDLDGDGLTNFEEFTLGTYPNDTDSDNDGIPDGEDTSPVPRDNEPRTSFDYDGDGISDIVIRRPEIGQFLVARSSDGAIMRAFFGSLGSDIPLAGDFDGDGTTDLAIRRPSVKQFISRTSSDDSINRIFFGSQDEDIPVIADYDGDGVDDIAIRRPSSGQWFIKYSSTGDIMRETFGTSTSDIPAVADYDGDGKADIAVRRQDAGQFIVKYSSTGEIDRIFFGSEATDIPVPADYDGDGKADIAIRRPESGFWFVKRSTDGVIERTFFGSQEDDIPVVADYDGDGKADIAIRRPASGTWVVKQSSDGSYTRLFFGSKATDIPLAAPLNTVLGMSNYTSATSATESLAGFEIDRSETLIKEAIRGEENWLTEEVTNPDIGL